MITCKMRFYVSVRSKTWFNHYYYYYYYDIVVVLVFILTIEKKKKNLHSTFQNKVLYGNVHKLNIELQQLPKQSTFLHMETTFLIQNKVFLEPWKNRKKKKKTQAPDAET